jgi:hypothetical protein
MTIVGISLHAGAIDDTLLFYQHVIMDPESIQSRAKTAITQTLVDHVTDFLCYARTHSK